MTLRVSVVVMTFNRLESVVRCLESLANQTLPREAFEVVVVDVSDRSVGDALGDFGGRLNLSHHFGENLGVAGNRNTGVARSRAPIVAFLDDDCVAEPGWLERLTTEVEVRPDGLVGGRVEGPGSATAYARTGQVITEAVHRFFNRPGEEPRFLPGLNFALARDRFRAIGGCDPRFGRLAAEDRDFVDRWRLAGGRLVFCSEAAVRHEHRGTLRGFVRQYFNYGRGAWRYHRLRRIRGSGRMAEDTGLHLRLPLHLQASLGGLVPGMRAKVILLLGVWQLANLVGFVWQGFLETALRRSGDGVV